MALRPMVHIDHYTDDTWAVIDCSQRVGEGTVAASHNGAAMVAALRLLGGPKAIAENVDYLRHIGCRSPHTLLDALLAESPW